MAKTKRPTRSPLIKGRIAAYRRRMKASNIRASLITNPHDYFYLTGFTGEDSAVLMTPKDVHLISDGRFDEAIKAECPWATVWMRKKLLNDEIAKVCKELKIKSLAIQHENMTLADHDALHKLAKSTRLRRSPPITSDMRELKDETEVRLIRKSIRVAEDAFIAMRDAIRVGDSEIEMAATLEYEMKRRGSSVPSFPTICAEGANAALPHAHPGKRKAKKGSAVLFDWGATLGGYASDLTRMVFIGSIPPRIKEIYPIVLEAQMRAIAAIKPGERMCDIDKVARDVIAKAGYAEQFNHGLGHGMGLNVHESPSLSWRSKAKLKAGMVVTVEPGIYVGGIGGVRIEDDVLVTARGSRMLSRLSTKLEDAVV